MEKNDEFENGRKKPIKKILYIIVILILALLVFVAVFKIKDFKKPKTQNAISTFLDGGTKEAEVVFTESELKEVLGISEFYTADYTYNSIVKVYDKDNETLRYNVAYEGKVKAGINFQNIKTQIDNENKKITVILPDVEIYDTTVDAGTLEYIFTDKKYNTENVAQEAYKLCCKDLAETAKQEDNLYSAAKSNAKAAVEALIKPWVEQTNSVYTVVVK